MKNLYSTSKLLDTWEGNLNNKGEMELERDNISIDSDDILEAWMWSEPKFTS